MRSVVVRNPVESPAQFIKQYVDWLKSHPSGTGNNAPASIGFMMAQDVPLDFGPDVVVSNASGGLQPEIIYSQGNLSISGGTSLVGHGFAEDAAVDLIVAAARVGLRGLRLLDVATAAVHELQRGATHGEALALVRRALPDVPSPPKPSPAQVNRARRPHAGV